MQQNTIIDAGALVALINRKDYYHQWASEQAKKLFSPFLTCEAVISEACFLLQNIYGGENVVMTLVESQKIIISFQLNKEVEIVRKLMQSYQSVPMSFADACLVRMSELVISNQIFTVDSDFFIYRKNRQENINLIIPFQ